MSRAAFFVAAWGLLLLTAWGAVWATGESRGGKPSDRATAHLAAIARGPRPANRPASPIATGDRARAYAVGVLSAAGFEVRLLTADGMTNVYAVRRGGDSTGTVLLAAHLDNVAPGLGAGDDGAACAAILAVAESLPPTQNTIAILLSDGEELGLLGARAWCESPDMPTGPGVALNFEGRGTRGATFLFESAGDEAWLLDRLADANVPVCASSLAGAVYTALRNNTDFTVFRGYGWTGLNFAHIGGFENYHRPTDVPANLAPGTLAWHERTAGGLARVLGDTDLRGVADRAETLLRPQGMVVARASFTLATGTWIRYPVALGWLVLVVAAGLWTRSAVVARPRWWHVTAQAVWFVAGVALAVFAVWWGVWATQHVHHRGVEWAYRNTRATQGVHLLATAAALLTGAVLMAWHRAIPARPSERNLAAVGATLALATALAIFIPGGSYAVGWPALAAAAFAGRGRLAGWAEVRRVGLSIGVGGLVAAPAMVGVFTAAPATVLMIPAGVLAMSVGPLVPTFDRLMGPRRGSWLAPVALLAAAVTLWLLVCRAA